MGKLKHVIQQDNTQWYNLNFFLKVAQQKKYHSLTETISRKIQTNSSRKLLIKTCVNKIVNLEKMQWFLIFLKHQKILNQIKLNFFNFLMEKQSDVKKPSKTILSKNLLKTLIILALIVKNSLLIFQLFWNLKDHLSFAYLNL
jgi:putative ribosome biogenesis GTPase RsgA